MAGTAGHNPGDSTPGRFSERQGGQAQPKMLSGSRMVSPSGGGARTLSAVGRALVRFVRLCRECAMSAVLCVGVSKAAIARRRFSSQVEFRPPVRLSAHTPSALSSQENQDRPGPSNPSGSGLGTESLVSRASQNEHQSSNQVASSGGSSVAAAGEGPSPKPVNFAASCLEVEQRQLMVYDLSS
ncbi:hypothetical protein NDU88_006619 [Pleurodeles waltl]|uniref:Uncharacterized protein n=1 Tax=Pleurodeles waltl TaxID=8319 RepID=A0AAV7SQE3_PLEWA|nr:hypothetical protein NDU88_006619 [Pleurodeles waltl]